MEFAIRFVLAILPVLTGFFCLSAPLELISFVMNDKNHTHRHERGRNDKDQNPTAQGLNHSSSCGGSLGVAKCAILGKYWKRDGQHNQSHQRAAKKKTPFDLHLSPFANYFEEPANGVPVRIRK